MVSSIKLGFGLAFVVLGAFVTGCSAGADGTATGETSADVKSVDGVPEYLSCQVDDDCLAVAQAGCCPNGVMDAVNKRHVRMYQDANLCDAPDQKCPIAMHNDTRVAQCNNATHACEMVAPEKVECGGNTLNPHACAEGFACDMLGHNPDSTGVCALAPKSDGSSTSN